MAPIPPKRICLIGPESTGKTTLAEQLARMLDVPWSREYAREYAEARNNNLSAADVEPIARGEIAFLSGAIGRAAAMSSPLVLHDTDLLSTVVYARHYYGCCPQWIEQAAYARRADLYLLLDTDVIWIADPARDSGEDEREDLFDAFRSALDELDCTWEIVSGDWQARIGRVRAAVETAAQQGKGDPSGL